MINIDKIKFLLKHLSGKQYVNYLSTLMFIIKNFLKDCSSGEQSKKKKKNKNFIKEEKKNTS